MNPKYYQFMRRGLRCASLRSLVPLLIGATSLPLLSQTQGVTGFDDNDWNADDVRNSSGTNIVNGTTNSPGTGATTDVGGVASQIDWKNFNGSVGNLGGVSLEGTTTGSGKSTLSIEDTIITCHYYLPLLLARQLGGIFVVLCIITCHYYLPDN